jgi:hypothetical protein
VTFREVPGARENPFVRAGVVGATVKQGEKRAATVAIGTNEIRGTAPKNSDSILLKVIKGF